jgi:multiple antibiotic resistance protein
MQVINFWPTFWLAFITFFATVSPINSLIIFMSLTGGYTSSERKSMAFKAIIISSSVLFAVMLFGAEIFYGLGISLSAVRTAGGILLLITSIGMMFGEDKEGVADKEKIQKKDISIFPLAVPIIAGPAAITTSMLFIQNFNNLIFLKGAVYLGLAGNLLLTLVLFLLSDRIINKIKKSVIEIFLRLAGLILASLAIQFIFDGLKESHIFN